MDRTKGKLKVDGLYIVVIEERGGCKLSNAIGIFENCVFRDANAEHLVQCWNALEPDGLVKRLIKRLEEVADITAGEPMNTGTLSRVKGVLLQFKEIN